MSLKRQGRLGIGLGASAALHALVALWVLRAPEAGPPPPPAGGAPGMELIELQLLAGARREEPPPSPRPRRAAGPASSPPPSEPGTIAPGPPELEAGSAPEGAVVAGAQPVVPSVSGEAEGQPAAAPAESGAGSGLAGGEGASGAAGGSGGGTVPPAVTQLLAARLAEAARRCYPREAVRFRLSGEARLSFCLGGDGRARAVSVARSSGAEALDRAAAECVLPRALPVPGAAGCYELPVRFTAQKP